MARRPVSASMSTFKPEREPPDGDDGGNHSEDEEVTPEGLDDLAEEALEGDMFVSFEDHNQERDD